MNKWDIFAENIPFYKEWFTSRRVEKYFHKYLKDFLGKTVLEIGCGNGEGAKVIQEYFSPQTLYATEFDKQLLETAKKRVTDKSIIFEQQDAAKLTYIDNKFDGIYSFKVIHHIPNWKDCLKELYRVLKPGGKVFIIEDSVESFHTVLGEILRLITSHPYDSLYTRKEFLDYLKKLEFKILEYKTTAQYLVIVAQK